MLGKGNWGRGEGLARAKCCRCSFYLFLQLLTGFHSLKVESTFTELGLSYTFSECACVELQINKVSLT